MVMSLFNETVILLHWFRCDVIVILLMRLFKLLLYCDCATKTIKTPTFKLLKFDFDLIIVPT